MINEKLIDKTYLTNYKIIPSWMKGTWDTKEDYLKRGFGYCAVFNNKELASVVFCCYINEKRTKCDLGVMTFDNHRLKGLAKALTAATIEYCLENNINEISWHCRDDNIASKKIAEAIGFKLDRKYFI